MRKGFSFVLVLLFLFVSVGIFAQGYNPNGVYPPYDIGKCQNMLGRALAAKYCPKLMHFWCDEKLWNDKERLLNKSQPLARLALFFF